LRSLGLEQYEEVFRKNEIDGSVLPDLTEDHLRELEFPLSARLHRRAARRSTRGAPRRNWQTLQTSASPENRAERRQVPLMVSDLVGTTALSARREPEGHQTQRSVSLNCMHSRSSVARV
jgi:hypothetical protein